MTPDLVDHIAKWVFLGLSVLQLFFFGQSGVIFPNLVKIFRLKAEEFKNKKKKREFKNTQVLFKFRVALGAHQAIHFQRLSEVIEFLTCRSRCERWKPVLSSRQCLVHTSVYCVLRHCDTYNTESLTEMFDSYDVHVPLF